MNPYRIRAYVYLLIANLIWGVAGVIIKFTLAWFDPSTFLLYRFAISSVFAILLLPFIKLSLPKNPRVLVILLIHGLLTSTVALGLLFAGANMTTALDAVLITSTVPIFVTIAGIKLFHEHLTKRKLVGISIAFFGTLITVAEPLLKNHDGIGALGGNLLIFASTLVGVVTAVLAKMLVKEQVKSESIVNIAFIIGFITILPFALLVSPPSEIIAKIITAPLPFHLGVWFMALLSGNVAYILWTKATKTIEIGEVSVFAYLPPIFATPLAVIWLGESLTVPFLIGAVIIATGVIIVEYKKRQPASPSLD